MLRPEPILLVLLFNLFQIQLDGQVDFTSSHLPIVVIDTEDQEIPDEPKVNVHLGLIYNGEGQTNHINDPFSEYNGRIGIELRGSSSQSFPKVGYGFETRDANGENNNVSLLGMPEENDWVLHGPFSDKSLIRNALAYKLGESLMDYAPRTRFVELVINGDYRGVYLLTEKIKRDKNRVDISRLNPDENEGDDLTGGYILKFDKATASDENDLLGFTSNFRPNIPEARKTDFLFHYPKPEDISPQQRTYIETFIDNLELTLKSDNFSNPQTGYRKYIDVPSFIRFLFVNEISKNVDGYRLSTFMYKDKESINNLLKMGPVWDFNLGFGNANYCEGAPPEGWALDFNDHCPDDYWVIHFWWDRLLEDSTFRLELREDWQALRTSILSDEQILGCIDSMVNHLGVAQERNFQRWPVLTEWVWPNEFVGGTYDSEIDYLKGWMIDRLEWLDQAFEELPGEEVVDPGVYTDPRVYPNPFVSEVTFEYYLYEEQPVSVLIYNFAGQLVAKFQNQNPDKYLNKQQWNLTLAPGIYYYELFLDGERSLTGKLIRQ